jgi:photosystem II stability/assembly factor-like uncharacterized protein
MPLPASPNATAQTPAAPDAATPADSADSFFSGGPALFQLADGGRAGWLWGARNGKLRLLLTRDGGEHWRPVLREDEQVPETGGEFGPPQVLFPNSRSVVVSWSDGKRLKLLRSDDLGETWSESSVADPVQAVDIQFVDDKYAWLLTTGLDAAMGHTQKKVFRSEDGGESWRLVSSDTGYIPDPDATEQALPEYGAALGLTFTSEKRGWAVLDNPLGAQLQLYRTADSGRTWQADALPPPDGIDPEKSYSVPEKPRFIDAQGQKGYFTVAYIADGTVRYGKFETSDGGVHWASQTLLARTGADRDRAELAFASESDGLALIGDELRKTADGGSSWRKVSGDGSLRLALAKTPIVQRMQFTDGGKVGWLLCRAEKGEKWALLGTRDGGASWQELASG